MTNVWSFPSRVYNYYTNFFSVLKYIVRRNVHFYIIVYACTYHLIFNCTIVNYYSKYSKFIVKYLSNIIYYNSISIGITLLLYYMAIDYS